MFRPVGDGFGYFQYEEPRTGCSSTYDRKAALYRFGFGDGWYSGDGAGGGRGDGNGYFFSHKMLAGGSGDGSGPAYGFGAATVSTAGRRRS